MFSLIRAFFDDPGAVLLFLVLAMPGRLLAISAHESAHAFVADRCGDPTGRLAGRISLNPLRHFDPLGILMMLTVGIGWAKPVPVNPLMYKNYRRDDLLVSIAGVTMNFILFILSALLIVGMTAAALMKIEDVGLMMSAQLKGLEVFTHDGALYWLEDDKYWYIAVKDVIAGAPYYGEYIMGPTLGKAAGYIYEMLGYSMTVNFMLMIFNLIPLPPLDGYHVLNDIVFKRNLFADRRVMLACQTGLIILAVSGYLSDGLGFVADAVFGRMGALAVSLFSVLGIL